MPTGLEGPEGCFGVGDGEGYHRLDKLATQLKNAARICTLNSELLLLEFCPLGRQFEPRSKLNQTACP